MRIAILLSVLYASSMPAFEGAERQPPPPPHSLPPSERVNEPDIPMIQPEPTDPAQKIRRDARSRIFTWGGPLLPLNTTGNFHFLMSIDRRAMPELPAGKEFSDAVIYGEIIKREIFVTQRERGLYTDYTLKVRRTLKPPDKVDAGSNISVLRLGGLARVPAGGTIEQEIRGYGPEPVVGSRYLFFLKYLPPPADAYTILTFWNVVTLPDGNTIVKAAFDQDSYESKNKQSTVDGKSLAEVEAAIQAASAR